MNNRQPKIGDFVVKRGSEICGVVIALRGCQAEIRWSPHTRTWMNTKNLRVRSGYE